MMLILEKGLCVRPKLRASYLLRAHCFRPQDLTLKGLTKALWLCRDCG